VFLEMYFGASILEKMFSRSTSAHFEKTQRVVELNSVLIKKFIN
jgi:hypothetical protein